MTKRFLVCVLAASCLVGIVACKSKKPAPPAEAEKEWYRYISAFTSGTISRKSTIRVLFVGPVAAPGPAAGLLEFSPGIAGTSEWKSPRELVFTPKGELEPGRDYKAVLHVGKILDLPKGYARFEFGFSVIRPGLEVLLDGLFAEDADKPQVQVLRGRLVTADTEEKALIEKVLEAEAGGRPLPVEWSHALDGLTHDFAVRGIERREEASAVTLSWDGGPIRVESRGRRDVEVPALGDFRLVSVEAVGGETRHVLVRFSDPLARGQSLQGLIRIENRPLTFEIDGNVVRVYSTDAFLGAFSVQVLPGIRNYLGRRLAGRADRQVTFESIRPQARFVGRGLILPRKDRLTVPIEAVNLKSIQVAAFQIYPGNMAQFFQVNSLEGSEELARVGRYLWRKTVPLSDDPALTSRWSRYDLDVTALFRENPGSLFRIVLSINRGNSVYPCAASDTPVVEEPPLRNLDDASWSRYSNWDYADEAYEYRPGDWARRNDPCADAYYMPRYNSAAVAGRNFFASDIGLVAKLEANGRLHVVTTDIPTGRPLPGLRVRAFNYQNRLLGETSSDGNGFAVFELEDRSVLRRGRRRRGHRLSPDERRSRPANEPFRRRRRGRREGRQGRDLRRARRLEARRRAPSDLRPLRPGKGPPGRSSRHPGALLAPGAARPDAQAREERRAVPRLPRRDRRDGADGQLAGPRPRRRPDLHQDPEDRDRRAEPAQDPPRPGPGGPGP